MCLLRRSHEYQSIWRCDEILRSRLTPIARQVLALDRFFLSLHGLFNTNARQPSNIFGECLERSRLCRCSRQCVEGRDGSHRSMRHYSWRDGVARQPFFHASVAAPHFGTAMAGMCARASPLGADLTETASTVRSYRRFARTCDAPRLMDRPARLPGGIQESCGRSPRPIKNSAYSEFSGTGGTWVPRHLRTMAEGCAKANREER